MHWRRKWQPAPVFLSGESQGRGAWWAAVYGVAQSRTRLRLLSRSSERRWEDPEGGAVVSEAATSATTAGSRLKSGTLIRKGGKILLAFHFCYK